MFRSSHRRNFIEKSGVLKSFTKFTGNHLLYCLFFNKIAGLVLPTNTRKPKVFRLYETLKRLQHRCFPVDFVKLLRTLFFK